MSLHPTIESTATVPEITADIARAAFPRGNKYLTLRDELGVIFQDTQFASLFSKRGQPAESPANLALISVLQYMEGLSDREAADAVRARIDWKYLLGLELSDPGFDASVLTEFRSRLVDGCIEETLLDTLLDVCRKKKVLRSRGTQRTDSTHVLAAIRSINRLELVGETMRHALNTLAVVAPEWLKEHSDPNWLKRYAKRIEDSIGPKAYGTKPADPVVIGSDGHLLLRSIANAVNSSNGITWLKEIPAVETMRQVWVQQYYLTPEGEVKWRSDKVEGLPQSVRTIKSPYDTEARYSRKTHAGSEWVGYKVHLTETCGQDTPNLITNVNTTLAPIADLNVVPDIHDSLSKKDLLPSQHIMDTGYADARHLIEGPKRYGTEVVVPMRRDRHWQARQNTGFDITQFQVDWDKKEITCPKGEKSHLWRSQKCKKKNSLSDGRELIVVQFPTKSCGPCESRSQCTRANHRVIGLKPQEEYEALRVAREREKSEEHQKLYALRSGIEGTMSQAIRRSGLRRSRYMGMAKTHLQHVLTATALNMVRLAAWFNEEEPEQTRQSAFASLMLQSCAA